MKLRVLAAVLLLAACDRGGTKKNLGRIAVDPSAINFGSRLPGESATAKLTLSNTGEAELHIASASILSDVRGAFSVSSPPPRLAVGATAELTVTYRAPLEEGVDGASVEIESDADNAPQLSVSVGARSLAPCPMGETFCSGDCADLNRSPGHCGSCANACPMGQVCSSGMCRPCTSGFDCGGTLACISGACGRCTASAQCDDGKVCIFGDCAPCTSSAQCDLDAGLVCLDMRCGPCLINANCAPGQACVAGRCGACASSQQCVGGQGCVNGACGACASNTHCGAGQACLDGGCGPCSTNAQCDADAGQVCAAMACGPCSSSAQCDQGLVCLANGACGPCSTNAQCGAGLACIGGRCAPCTSNAQCPGGEACVAGACGPCTLDTQCAAGEACFSGSCGPCTTDVCTMKGLIVAWSGSIASIPSGWVLADGQNGTPDLRGWFLKGAPAGTNPGGTGGAATHDHGGTTGTVMVTSAAAGTDTCGLVSSGCSWIENPNSHTHTLTHAHAVDPASSLPPFYEAVFIVKQNTSLAPPTGAIVGWSAASSPSGGWLPLDGNAAVPDLRGRFLRGAAAGVGPGGIGGSLTHDHDGGTSIDSTHTSQAGAGLYGFASACGNGCSTSGEFGHYHTYPHAHAISAANHEPPFMLVSWVTADNAAAFPTGAIAMWTGSVVSPPRGWAVCDGTNGTPDLTGRFLKGTTAGATPGTGGGAATHSHGGFTEADDGGLTTFSPNTNGQPGGSTGQSVHQHAMPPHAHPLPASPNDPPHYHVVYLIKR